MIESRDQIQRKVCTTSPSQCGQRGVESCTPQQAEEYCRLNAQGGPPLGYGGQQWRLVDRQAECMPPLGHYGHLGQWAELPFP